MNPDFKKNNLQFFSSFNDEINLEAGAPLEAPVHDVEEMYEQPQHRIDLDFLKSPTGEGDLKEYKTHLLNFNGSKGMARIIRGCTGLFGNLNFAVIDIIIGIFDLTSKKKQQGVVPDVDVYPSGDFS
jgi:hypothetical protein